MLQNNTQEMSVRRTTTPVRRKNGGAGRPPDWQHEETVTVRRVRRMPAAEAQQHIGGDGGISVSSGPGIRTGWHPSRSPCRQCRAIAHWPSTDRPLPGRSAVEVDVLATAVQCCCTRRTRPLGLAGLRVQRLRCATSGRQPLGGMEPQDLSRLQRGSSSGSSRCKGVARAGNAKKHRSSRSGHR